MKVVVVVPTYSEAENLPELVRRIFALDIQRLELVVVDDNSPDGTGEIAEELAKQHPQSIWVIHRARKMGLGTAYKEGFRLALERGADFVIEMDADLSHLPEYIPYMVANAHNADLVVGSRYVQGSEETSSWSLKRRLLSGLANLGIRWIVGLPMRDTTSGFKCFRRRVLEELPWDSIRSEGFAFQVEVHHACHRLGFNIEEYPIQFTERAQGKSKMSAWIVLEALWRLPALRWRRIMANSQRGSQHPGGT